MDAKDAVVRLSALLAAHADPSRAANEKNYQKSDLEFFGVQVPKVRAITKGFARENKDLSREDMWSVFEGLWATRVWELRAVGVGLLELHPGFVGPEDLPRIKELVVESDGWAFNDWFGCHIVGGIVFRHPRALKVIDGWAVDENLWVRRVAIQSLLLPLRGGDLTEWPRFVRYAEPLFEATDFWTRKVIGWVCREVSKKSPEPVFEFLNRNLDRASGLSLREGAKYLSADLRAKLGLKA